VYHVVGSQLSPFEAAKNDRGGIGCDPSLVQKTTFAEMFTNRAPTPQYAGLSNDKIKALGVAMHSFAEGIAEVKKQES